MQCGNSSGLVGAQYAGLNIVCLAFGCVLLFYLFGVNNWGKKKMLIFRFCLLTCLSDEHEWKTYKT